MRTKVAVLHTGGTLGMVPREPDRALAPDEFGATLLENIPELADLADVHARMLFNIDSSDIGPEQWEILGRVIAETLPHVDGVVVTHGTDAMTYTASALSYLLRNLPKPVILTGSQIPLADARTDARANVIGAVDLVRHGIAEVAIYFRGVLLRGNRAVKQSSFAFGAFQSPNFLPLAEVGTDVRRVGDALEPVGPFRLEGRFDPRVAAIRLLPGTAPTALGCLHTADVRAVLLEAFGCGNVPVAERAVADAIRRLTSAGRVVAIGSQPMHGTVDLSTYVGGRLARESGAVGIADMTLDAAAVKLMYLLGTYGDPQRVARLLTQPLAGEVTPE